MWSITTAGKADAGCSSAGSPVVVVSMPLDLDSDLPRTWWECGLRTHTLTQILTYAQAPCSPPPPPSPLPSSPSPVAMWNGGGHRPRMWLGVSNQTMHTGGNGVMVARIAGWSSASFRQLPL